ncbi:hypothetical protein DYB28_009493 [Aphanomyces astaci]|uniref:Uncharacterized protein n=1 Tax=Aphanomyces astaci TaxID=112090 RepID=A0A9X8DLC3_APHAT|nr:hypothetical protein DYB28_009493 [Aphanomyces astaci]
MNTPPTNISCQDPKLSGENWDRFLPVFKKKNVQTKKPHVVREKRVYTPFPPAPTPSKIDKEIESGEYFMKEHERQAIKQAKKTQANLEVREQKKAEKASAFVAPAEKKRKRDDKNKFAPTVDDLKNKFLAQEDSKKKAKSAKVSSLSDFVSK